MIGLLITALLMAISLAAPVTAASSVPTTTDDSYFTFTPSLMRSTPISFNFTVKVNAGSVSSSSAFKDDEDGYASVNSLKSTTVSSTNKIAFRVRADAPNNPAASDLYVRSDTSGFSIWYWDGYGVAEDYKLWASAPSTNKAAVTMSGKFYP